MSSRAEPIAIVGIGCRFPGGVTTPDEFWQLLRDGVDAIQPIEREGLELNRYYDPRPKTPGRMVSQWGGFLEDLERFDANFFGISPREAMSIDPSQRLLIETAWEACEDAAIDPRSLAGRPAGVYVGQWVGDYESRLFTDSDELDLYGTTGSGRYASSGRLSYLFGLTGPSLTIDSACSSSLVAVHLGCQSLRSGETSLAIAGGVNIILQPQITIAYSQGGVMAPDGRCKFGDASADGYVRSEGAAVVLLKRLSDALADGDPIRAVIRGSAVNHDGRSNSHLTTPSRAGQAAMLRAAYADAGVEPGDVGYVEAHGTGTRVGDPIELGALGDVFGPRQSSGRQCLVGSVKTNIGHTEAVAGLAGLIKCVLALQHGKVPPSLHLHQPNPAIAWDELPFAVPQQVVEWPRGDAPRVAGVSAYGITGTNAHVVLEEAPPDVSRTGSTVPDGRSLPLVLSAATPRALRDLASAYAVLLEAPLPLPLFDVCATAALGRAALEHRAVFVGADNATMIEALRRFAAGDEQSAAALAHATVTTPRCVAFAFPGQGGQWTGMARELLLDSAVFAATIDRCDAALPTGSAWTVRGQLCAEPGTAPYRLDEISVLQPTLLAVEIGIAEVWRSWGVTPAAAVGHSMGELGAAYIAGTLSLEEAMSLICARSALMQCTSGAGAMALLELGIEEAQQRIAPFGERVCIAVSNGPRSTVVSGDPDAIADVLAACARDDVFGRAVRVDVASHSPQMDPLVPQLVAAAANVSPQPSPIALYSTVDAALRPGDTWNASYWGRNLRQPVMFGRTVERMLDDGVDVLIEVGPHPTLLAGIAAPADGEAAPLLLGSLRREAPERATLLSSLGALWAAGHPVDWSRLFSSGSYAVVALPLYPWQRERHWAAAAQATASSGAHRRQQLDEEAQGWHHVLQWHPAPLVPSSSAWRWLLVGGAEELEPLRMALARRGATADVVPTAEVAAHLAGETPPGDRTEVGIIISTEPDASAFEVVSAVQVMHASNRDKATRARLWWLTRGAHAVAAEPPSPHAAAQGAIWGAARVAAVEHPDRWGGLVDLDPCERTADQAEALADHLCSERTEDQVALRNSQRYALRLVQAEPPVMTAPEWRTDSAYLITGGFGGVSQRIAAAMVRDGARRLVLLSRTALPPRAVWPTLPLEDPRASRVAFVRSLEHAGASVHILTADVSDEEEVRAALDSYTADGWPPIVGVIHAAAVLENQLTDDLDRAAFDRVIAPKLGGALVLDSLLPELDLFVLFSSISAFWAPAGMANYAAANAGLDALALARRARGQHAISIQWGPWSGVGMHDRAVAGNVDQLALEGVGALEEHQALAYFGALATSNLAVTAVLPMDWTTYRRAHKGWLSPLYRDAPGADEASPGAGVVTALHAASAAERRRLLESLVREALGRVLRRPAAQLDVQRPFGLLGLDSLMALELRNRLQTSLERPLPATLAWNYPTVIALVGHLDDLVAPAADPADLPGDGDTTPVNVALGDDDSFAQLLGDFATLSDDDAARALRGAR